MQEKRRRKSKLNLRERKEKIWERKILRYKTEKKEYEKENKIWEKKCKKANKIW